MYRKKPKTNNVLKHQGDSSQNIRYSENLSEFQKRSHIAGNISKAMFSPFFHKLFLYLLILMAKSLFTFFKVFPGYVMLWLLTTNIFHKLHVFIMQLHFETPFDEYHHVSISASAGPILGECFSLYANQSCFIFQVRLNSMCSSH